MAQSLTEGACGAAPLAAAGLAEAVLEASDDGILAFDRQCRYIFWNRVMERISGLGRAAVLGRSAFEVTPLLKERGEDRCFAEALEGRGACSRDRSYDVAPSGRKGFYDAYYSPLRGDDGVVVGGVAVVRDVTERRLAEEREKESEDRFRIMADCAPVMLWMAGDDARCQFSTRRGSRSRGGRSSRRSAGAGRRASTLRGCESFSRGTSRVLSADRGVVGTPATFPSCRGYSSLRSTEMPARCAPEPNDSQPLRTTRPARTATSRPSRRDAASASSIA